MMCEREMSYSCSSSFSLFEDFRLMYMSTVRSRCTGLAMPSPLIPPNDLATAIEDADPQTGVTVLPVDRGAIPS